MPHAPFLLAERRRLPSLPCRAAHRRQKKKGSPSTSATKKPAKTRTNNAFVPSELYATESKLQLVKFCEELQRPHHLVRGKQSGDPNRPSILPSHGLPCFFNVAFLALILDPAVKPLALVPRLPISEARKSMPESFPSTQCPPSALVRSQSSTRSLQPRRQSPLRGDHRGTSLQLHAISLKT